MHGHERSSCVALTQQGPVRTQLVLPQNAVQQDQSQNCQLCIAAVTMGEGFLIGSGEVQDMVRLMLMACCYIRI